MTLARADAPLLPLCAVAGLAACVAGACSPSVSGVTVRGPAGPPPLVLELAGRGARHYNAPTPAPAPGPPGDRVTALVNEAAALIRRPAPRRDARLDAVCDALARVLPDDRHTPFELVEFALQHEGLIEPAPRLLLATVTADSVAAFVASLRRRLPPLLAASRFRRFGVGVLRTSRALRLVVALQESFFATRPFPRVLEPPGTRGFRIVGRVDPAFTAPRVYVTRPDGSVTELEVERQVGGDLAIDFACAGLGRHQVEVTADERLGATVLANFPVYCGTEPPRRAVAPAGDDLPVRDPRNAERQLVALLNADRLQHHVPVLDWHAGLAELARAHSRDMAEQEYVGHVSPRFGATAERVRRARIEVGFLLENVARAYSAGEAHRGLMASPAHRRNLLSPAVTLVGVGVVLGRETAGRREIYVTEILIKPPRKLQPLEDVFTVQ